MFTRSYLSELVTGVSRGACQGSLYANFNCKNRPAAPRSPLAVHLDHASLAARHKRPSAGDQGLSSLPDQARTQRGCWEE